MYHIRLGLLRQERCVGLFTVFPMKYAHSSHFALFLFDHTTRQWGYVSNENGTNFAKAPKMCILWFIVQHGFGIIPAKGVLLEIFRFKMKLNRTKATKI